MREQASTVDTDALGLELLIELHLGDRERVAAIMPRYLAARGNPNRRAPNVQGMTLLHYCALEGMIDQVNQLLRANAALHAGDRRGMTPLHAAVVGTHHDIAELLLLAGANPNAASQTGLAPIHLASVAGDRSMLELLVQATANPNKQDSLGYGALHFAVLHKHFELIPYLLEHGARTGLTDGFNKIAWDYAESDDERERLCGCGMGAEATA